VTPRRAIDGWEDPRRARKLGAKKLASDEKKQGNGSSQGPCVLWLSLVAAVGPIVGGWRWA
jgi:hypothetical protein